MFFNNLVYLVILLDLSENMDKDVAVVGLNQIMSNQAQLESDFAKLTIMTYGDQIDILRKTQNIKNCIHVSDDELKDRGESINVLNALKELSVIIEQDMRSSDDIAVAILSKRIARNQIEFNDPRLDFFESFKSSNVEFYYRGNDTNAMMKLFEKFELKYECQNFNDHREDDNFNALDNFITDFRSKK